MATAHIIDKVKGIANKAKAIQEACDAFVADPNLQEVTDLFAMFNAFATGHPNPNNGAAKTKRVRRSRAEIEAEKAAKEGGKV